VQPLNLVDPKVFANGPPHAFFDLIRREDPAYRIDDPHFGTLWSLTRQADIRKVSANNALYSSRNGIMYPMVNETGPRYENQLLFHSGARHSRLRGLVAGALTPRVVARFDPWIREICVRIVREIKEKGRFDAIPAIAAELPAQVISSVLGIPEEDRGRILNWAVNVFGRLDPEIGVEGFMAAREAAENYALSLRELKIREPGVDMATELLAAAPQDQPITEGEYQQMVFTIMLAGFETTHTLIAQSLLLMAQDEDARRQVDSASTQDLRAVLDELLRFTSPVMHMSRVATEDFELHGKKIRAGDYLLMWYTAANRDPEVYADPHRFDLSRNAKSHMAFGGGGIHFCVGAALARLEVDILLQEFRKSNIRLELDGTPKRSVDVAINAMRKLPMRLA
jgi:cholest-4-en-3-one 26-monooxygenase